MRHCADVLVAIVHSLHVAIVEFTVGYAPGALLFQLAIHEYARLLGTAPYPRDD